jgi:hypothetical protein
MSQLNLDPAVVAQGKETITGTGTLSLGGLFRDLSSSDHLPFRKVRFRLDFSPRRAVFIPVAFILQATPFHLFCMNPTVINRSDCLISEFLY